MMSLMKILYVFACRSLPVFIRQAYDTGVDAVRVSERVRGALQLRGGRAIRGRIVPDVLRGVILLRVDRAAQPERRPVVQRDVLHVLRAVA